MLPRNTSSKDLMVLKQCINSLPPLEKTLFILGNGKIGAPAVKEIGAQTKLIIIKARK